LEPIHMLELSHKLRVILTTWASLLLRKFFNTMNPLMFTALAGKIGEGNIHRLIMIIINQAVKVKGSR
jgi:hypothetical protein